MILYCNRVSSGSVISDSNLTVTSSCLIEHACNDPQGSIEREEFIVGEQYREEKRSKREYLELHMRCSRTVFYLPLSYNKNTILWT